MTRLRPIVFLILVFALQCLQIASAKAQSGEPPDNSPDDTGLWLAIFGRGDISHEALSEQSRWWFDGHMRLFDDSNGFGQSIVRPGIGYAVNEQTTVWAGYGWIRTAPPAGFDNSRVGARPCAPHLNSVSSSETRSSSTSTTRV